MRRIFVMMISLCVAASAFGKNGSLPGRMPGQRMPAHQPTLSEAIKITDLNRFRRDEKRQIVTDSNTSLQWQDDNGTIASGPKKDWEGAIAYCKALALGGYGDWRLPNVKELGSITDKSRQKPAINTAAFKHGTPQYYWSSSPVKKDEGHAWTVNFYDGREYRNLKDFKNYIRCVRNKQ